MPKFDIEPRFPLRVVTELIPMLRLKTFVETGTGSGRTTGYMSGLYRDVHSIELDPIQALDARKKLAECKNVHIHLGASEDIFHSLLPTIGEDAIFFWLDGHYSGPGTACGDTECPVLSELEAIVKYCKNTFVVGIDDARLFDNPPEPPHDPTHWPKTAQILEQCNVDGRQWIKSGDALFWIPVNELTKAWLFNLEKTGIVQMIGL